MAPATSPETLRTIPRRRSGASPKEGNSLAHGATTSGAAAAAAPAIHGRRKAAIRRRFLLASRDVKDPRAGPGATLVDLASLLHIPLPLVLPSGDVANYHVAGKLH